MEENNLTNYIIKTTVAVVHYVFIVWARFYRGYSQYFSSDWKGKVTVTVNLNVNVNLILPLY